jgi:hypothetical protein
LVSGGFVLLYSRRRYIAGDKGQACEIRSISRASWTVFISAGKCGLWPVTDGQKWPIFE